MTTETYHRTQQEHRLRPFSSSCLSFIAGPGIPRSRRWRVGNTAGITTAVLAPIVLAIGIPLWAVGAHREKKIRGGFAFTPTGVAGTF